MSVTYTFQRGRTISVALDCVEGDMNSVTAFTAALRAIPKGRATVDPKEPVAANFQISTRTAVGDTPAGWTLTIPANTSKNIAAGSYLADAKITIGSDVIEVDPITIVVQEPATL